MFQIEREGQRGVKLDRLYGQTSCAERRATRVAHPPCTVRFTEKRFGRSEYASTGRLYINDRLVSEGRLEHVANPYIGMTSLTGGRAAKSPVSKDYGLPFTYGGQIYKVEVDLR
jgi:hypothetical protein